MEREVPPPPRPPWKMLKSVFAPRQKECDAKAFFDTDSLARKTFETDWARCNAKEKFASMLQREAKATGRDDQSPSDQVKALAAVVHSMHGYITSTFMYYAGVSGAAVNHLQLNNYTQWLDDTNVPDNESKACKRSDLDTLFIMSNFTDKQQKEQEGGVNNENSLMRFEFIEALTRIAVAKYGRGYVVPQQQEGGGSGRPLSLPEAFEHLMSSNMLPNLPPEALLDRNEFRRTRLYFEEVDDVLKKHRAFLTHAYNSRRIRDLRSGLRPKTMKLEHWQALMDDCLLVDRELTMREVTLCYSWSRMGVSDEVGKYDKVDGATFVDFLEALGRVADYMSLPDYAQLAKMGYASVMEYWIERRRTVEREGGGDGAGEDAAEDAGGGGGGAGGRGGAVMSPVPQRERSFKAVNSGAGATTGGGGGGAAELVGFAPRLSAQFTAPKTRPLSAKLEVLVDLMARALHYDRGAAKPSAFSYDAVVKALKKADHQLGT